MQNSHEDVKFSTWYIVRDIAITMRGARAFLEIPGLNFRGWQKEREVSPLWAQKTGPCFRRDFISPCQWAEWSSSPGKHSVERWREWMLARPVRTHFREGQASAAAPSCSLPRARRGLILLDHTGVADVLRGETTFDCFFFVANVMHVVLGDFWYLEWLLLYRKEFVVSLTGKLC